MKIKNLLSVIRSNQSRKGLFVILHCDTNFVSLSDGVVKELAIQKKGIPFIFVYKTEHESETVYALKRVKYDFAVQTQVGLVTKNQKTGFHVFENMCPTNQAIFFDLGLPHDQDQKFSLKKRIINESTEYILHYESNSKQY
ncbi:hypothetical protein NXX39_20805 [Bacteroides ovatus]|jgi:hypothetical protein|uniref:hypothetical protein n=1 Tax=Bacteroides ovatus TaxID=28116 RepID=UPI001CCD7DFF|nr:hypothetical protein [Bacteroides ovatus]MCS2475519.1 hypothetical protein [Bacteroides ovatus]MCS3099763.1 hypothetical protein [Bacteroides ovatus]UBF06660.1 hypothetical protein K6V23_19760 [Bacteroides ovatus]DAU74116.1 MAG TPA: hypothetical protein [Crassvirales sp.]